MQTNPSHTVLVVEDDAAMREMLSWALELEGLRVMAAANGVEALTALAQCTPSIILTDMQMPYKDGLALAMEIKAKADCNDIPIVLLSATPPTAQAEIALFDSILTKPVAIAALMRCIRDLLGQPQAQARPA